VSALTKKIREAMEDGTIVHRYPSIKALCDDHERLEAAIRGEEGEPRAILTTNVLRWSDEERIAFARHLLGAEWKAPEHEQVEAEHAETLAQNLRLATECERLEDVLLKRNAEIAENHIEDQEKLAAEIKALCDSLESGATAELRRLEGLLCRWGIEGDIRSRDLVYAEAVRLAKEKP